jgi:hypothetical protein
MWLRTSAQIASFEEEENAKYAEPSRPDPGGKLTSEIEDRRLGLASMQTGERSRTPRISGP